ncbi:hypothetical protein HMPREF9446_01530 [Bacteroides fluxus YIT 12057]|uniref:Uncharacterized protein n=1 Tax=Bacteroides fluxus YIT 12057 TaxID=763034 RepID=F3PS26_9BACE|nr:hypothetical protein HMPREF9446_01530 [Bacteroides fluxus YIT 12057]
MGNILPFLIYIKKYVLKHKFSFVSAPWLEQRLYFCVVKHKKE